MAGVELDSRFHVDPYDYGGKDESGERKKLDRRLYVQLLAFGGAADETPLVEALEGLRGGDVTGRAGGDTGTGGSGPGGPVGGPAAGDSSGPFEGVLYLDAHDPTGVALLSWHEDPEMLMRRMRSACATAAFASLTPKPELTMIGRTYSIGYEGDLEETLLRRPKELATKREWPWVSWYPLRRTGSFAMLDHTEQREVLGEHGKHGRAFSEAGFGRDIRLVCYGMDRNDNDFVLGLVGPSLHRVSKIVGEMRKTVHTAKYLERLGPFFVGKAVWWGDAE